MPTSPRRGASNDAGDERASRGILGTDFFSVREQFTDEQWSHFITVRRFFDEEVVPVVGPYWERAEICWPLVRRLPELGIVRREDGLAAVVDQCGGAGAARRVAAVGADERDPQRFWLLVLGALSQTAPGSAVVRPLTAAPELDGWAITERLLKGPDAAGRPSLAGGR